MTASGIYKIEQISQGRVVYVGSAQDVKKRLAWHSGQLNRGNHNNRHLQSVWNKHGAADFELSQIEETPQESLVEREQYWMDQLKPLCNFMTAADNGAGWKHSPESLAKIGASQRGKVVSTDTRRKKSIIGKRLMADPARRAALAESNIGNKNFQGHKHTEETKRKMSEASKRYMELHPERAQAMGAVNRGRKLSDEVRKKISESSMGKQISPKTRKKISESGKGRIVSKETRKKLGNINRGKPMSDEQKKKLSLAMTGKKKPPFSEEHKRKLREVLRKANEKRYGNDK